ncbi:MAG TPA: GMC family oxidoreductase [Gemmatimonadaceae bacterium]
MIEREYDVVIVGSGAGGGTVAQELAPLARAGARVLVLERGPRFDQTDFTGGELEMAPALYADEGGFLTADGTMTLAFAHAYGGSTVVYTGTSLVAPERVIRDWEVPGLFHADLARRSRKFMEQNGVDFLPPDRINENNRLFVEGCAKAGYHAEQFPLNLRGCRGSSLCNLGCPNLAKQGTHRVQLPAAEAGGVEVVTRAEALRVEERAVVARVSERAPGAKGRPSEWAPGAYRIRAKLVVLSGGAVGTSALLLRSGFGRALPRIGEGFTCHPAHILVAEHEREITNDVGHPKSYYLDRAESERFVLETCMYFPFTTAKNMTGFGEPHERLMRAYPRLQMILVLACDRATAGNRITVDGAGRPVVHYRFTDDTVGALVAATRASARIFFAAGAVRVHAPSADPPLLERSEMGRLESRVHRRHFKTGRISVSAAHLMGGAGMGEDAYDSVTDAFGRVHGVPWLRVADASLFPDSLEINPYLTIMALADRVAEGIRRDAPSLLGVTAAAGERAAATPAAPTLPGSVPLEAPRPAPRA